MSGLNRARRRLVGATGGEQRFPPDGVVDDPVDRGPALAADSGA